MYYELNKVIMSNHSKIILNDEQLGLTINRLSFEIIENYQDSNNTVIIGRTHGQSATWTILGKEFMVFKSWRRGC